MPSVSATKAWKDLWRFAKAPEGAKKLVIYSEGPEYWLHYSSLIEELLRTPGIEMSYVSSSPDDPGLTFDPGRVHPYCIGFGFARTLWFMTLKAKVLAMTMPDLNTFHIKRSLLHPVKYVYLFHAPVSTHMMYRAAAFDNFDEIFCVGPHHDREIRKREELSSLKQKTLFHHGCTRLDILLAKNAARPAGGAPNEPPWALIAPSWFEEGIIGTVVDQLTAILLDAGLKVTVRPHPRTRLIHPETLASLRQKFGRHERFALEDGTGDSAALERADIMVSDWSGVAIEYAFTRGKPVLFIDTPRKVNNPDYAKLGLEPMEAEVRSDIGEVLPLNNLSEAPAAIRRLCANPGQFARQCLAMREKWIYNVGQSARAGAERLAALMREPAGGSAVRDA